MHFQELMIIFRSNILKMRPELPYTNSYVKDEKNQPVRFIPLDYQNQTGDTDFPNGLSNALWVGGAGNVSVVTAMGTSIVIPNVSAGTYLLGQFKRINSSGTTVTTPDDKILVVY